MSQPLKGWLFYLGGSRSVREACAEEKQPETSSHRSHEEYGYEANMWRSQG